MRLVVTSLMAAVTSALAHFRVMPSSQPAYSFFRMASNSAINASNSASFPAGIATAASQREQITLSNWPPETAASRRP